MWPDLPNYQALIHFTHPPEALASVCSSPWFLSPPPVSNSPCTVLVNLSHFVLISNDTRKSQVYSIIPNTFAFTTWQNSASSIILSMYEAIYSQLTSIRLETSSLCYKLSVRIPKNSYVEILTLILGGWPLGGTQVMHGISALIKKTPESSLLPTMWLYNEKPVVHNFQDGLHQKLTLPSPWSHTSSLQNCEK